MSQLQEADLPIHLPEYDKNSDFAISQQALGKTVPLYFQDLLAQKEYLHPHLQTFLSRLDRIGGQLCAATTAFTIANDLLGQQVFTEENGGKALRILADHHDKPHLVDAYGNSYPRFHAFDKEANTMYQALVAMLMGLGLSGDVSLALPDNILRTFLQNGGKAAVSINKTFITDHTDPLYSPSDATGHVVGLLGISRDNDPSITITDPYAFPQPQNLIALRLSEFARYTTHVDGQSVWKGMYFAKESKQLALIEPYRATSTVYPIEIMERFQQFAEGNLSISESFQ